MLPQRAAPQGFGVFDNHTTGVVELTHAFQRRVGIGDVVEGQFPPLNLFYLGDGRADGPRVGIKRGLLVRIFAVPHERCFEKKDSSRPEGRGRTADGAGEVRRDHGVVLRRGREAFALQFAAHGQIGAALIGFASWSSNSR